MIPARKRPDESRSYDGNRIVGVGACVAGMLAACALPASADAVNGTVNPASSIRLVGRDLTFSTLGKAGAKTFAVTKPFYTRTFNASSTCGQGDRAIARFTPAATAGPTATFTVTPLNPGTCTITVSDDGSGSVRIAVTVLAPSPAPRPSSTAAAS